MLVFVGAILPLVLQMEGKLGIVATGLPLTVTFFEYVFEHAFAADVVVKTIE